jgi:hypothetical protein
MKERPIIFSGEMVKAILEGRKTQTRRVIKPQPKGKYNMTLNSRAQFIEWGNKAYYPLCPYGSVGDRLWVREVWREAYTKYIGSNGIIYKADKEKSLGMAEYCAYKWKSPIHMPRWASRITLEITDIRVERLQEISEVSAYKEGVNYNPYTEGISVMLFQSLWNSLAKKGFKWEDDPWVWVLEFERIRGRKR